MAFATERDKVAVIEAGLSHPFWTEYLLPLLQEKAKMVLSALATKKADDDDIKRGRFQAYQDIISAPLRDTELYRLSQQDAERDNALKQAEDFRVQHGFRSPIRDVPEAGDTRVDEAATN